MNKLTETAPERIWLQISDDVTDLDCEFSAIERAAEVTGCAVPVVEAEVGYVRNDFLKAANARIAELESQIKMLRTGDTCGRSCEGTAYRIGERTALAQLDAAQKRIAELERRANPPQQPSAPRR